MPPNHLQQVQSQWLIELRGGVAWKWGCKITAHEEGVRAKKVARHEFVAFQAVNQGLQGGSVIVVRRPYMLGVVLNGDRQGRPELRVVFDAKYLGTRGNE